MSSRDERIEKAADRMVKAVDGFLAPGSADAIREMRVLAELKDAKTALAAEPACLAGIWQFHTSSRSSSNRSAGATKGEPAPSVYGGGAK